MKGLFKYNLRPIHGGSFGYEIGIKFNNSPLVAVQNNYKTKIVILPLSMVLTIGQKFHLTI